MATQTTNPHPPIDGQETVTCQGCGHDVSAMDDLMSWDDQDAPDGLYVAHVDCPTDGRGTRQDDSPEYQRFVNALHG